MDMITLAMAKAYSDKKGGYAESLTASFVVPEDKTPDVTLMNIGFKWFSGVTPTKEEFLAGRITQKADGREQTNDISYYEPNVVAEATGAYCVMVGGVWFVISTVLENELGTLPKTGIYYSISNDTEVGTKVTLDFGERIVPIDQKYLTKVVDLTKYDAGGNSLNDVVLGLFMNGGGKTSVSKTAGTDAFWHDVSDGRSIRFLIDAMSVKILADANSFTFESDGATVVAIETSFLIINGGSTFRVTVLLGYGSEAEITVAVEPVAVPGA